MDEELINLTTEETVEIVAEEIVESEVRVEDLEQSIEIKETVETIEIETVEEIDIEMDEAVGWVGGDSTRHYSLYGRDEANQHPITAITGLREELNDIEALDIVYSNKRNQANYYLWEDENILQENRIGYFVNACSDIDEIKICTSSDDIFGVTVDTAGFIGGQSDISRDIKYGLVTTTGVVRVRCESSVDIGDYVVSNDYGQAQKNKNGYKVVGRHQIDGVEYAEITLTTPINRICKLSNDVEDVNTRMDDAETNIVAAINVANAAYNKAGEVGEISEEAIRNALEALDKSNETSEKTDEFESRLEDANEAAVQAKAIAESAVVSAEAIRQEAVNTSNGALAEVNDLIKDLEPITTWSDPESGNVGAEYLTNYINNGLATNLYVAEVNTKTDDNKSAIEHNAESFRTLVASVDKYSVGEYSQSYGLTHKQAESILKEGMIYVPTKHSDSRSHSETFEDTGEENEFTPGNHYKWDGNDWIEYGNSVAFFSEEPTPSRVLQYWYIDSDNAPEGYEPRALYIYEDGKWVKVNIFYNNPGNRMVSSISQEVDNISLEITNARGSYAGLNARLEADNKAQVAMVASVVGEDGNVTTASIINAVNNSESSVAINANHIVLNGYTSNADGSFQIDKNGYMIAKAGTIGGLTLQNKKMYVGTEWLQDNKWYSVVSGINPQYKSATNNTIFLFSGVERYASTSTNDGWLNNTFGSDNYKEAERWIVGGTYDGKNYGYGARFYVAHTGALHATGATIDGTITAKTGEVGGWTIKEGFIGKRGTGLSSEEEIFISQGGQSAYVKTIDPNPNDNNYGEYYKKCVLYVTNNFAVDTSGSLYANNATLKGSITATTGSIGGWKIDYNVTDSAGNYKGYYLSYNNDQIYLCPQGRGTGSTAIYVNGNFIVDTSGNITAKSGSFSRGITIEGKPLSNWISSAGDIYSIKATNGTIGGWNIKDGKLFSNEVNVKSSGGITFATRMRMTGENIAYRAVGATDASSSNYRACQWHNIVEAGNAYYITDSSLSDVRFKKDIVEYSDKYEIFYDSLKPVKYKYINGTSDRFHTGFIAQEVVEALETSGLTTQDFAGVMLTYPGEEDECWRLRRDEFVSLNTWQIQKAKARITELENKVAELEALIKGE